MYFVTDFAGKRVHHASLEEAFLRIVNHWKSRLQKKSLKTLVGDTIKVWTTDVPGQFDYDPDHPMWYLDLKEKDGKPLYEVTKMMVEKSYFVPKE